MDATLVRVPGAQSAEMTQAAAVAKVIAVAESAPDLRLSLGEWWPALHFMLSGDVPIPRPEALRRGVSWDDRSLESVLMGGEATPYRDSLGAARVLSPRQVARLAQRLDERGVDAIMGGLDVDAMHDEGILSTEDDEDVADALRSRLESLVEFYRAAAADGDAILVYVV